MPLARYKTAGDLLNKAALKLGLAEVADPFADTNPEWKRLVQLLNDVGQELAGSREWSHLLVEYTIVGDGATTTYDLPADFGTMVEQSGWNRDDDQPLAGPLSVQLWQYRKAVTFTPAVSVEFRLDANEVRFTPAIPSGETVAFEYRSRSWVRSAAQGLGDGNTLGASGHDEAAASGDYVLFDPLLMRRLLVLGWREDNGFDTTKAQEAAQRSLDQAESRSAGAPVLRLSSRGRRRALGNVPDGSWTV